MSVGRVALLLVLTLAVGAGGTLVIEGNTAPVSLHLGSFTTHAEASLWIVIAFAFLGGAITVGLLAGSVWLLGLSFNILIGTVFALILAAAVIGNRGDVRVALLVGLLSLLVAA